MTCDDRPPGALRPLVLDTTHLVARLSRVRTSGIDKVDFAYARHFSAGGSQFDVELDRPRPGAWPLSGVAHYGLRRPRIHTVTALTELLKRWSDIPAEQGFAQAYQWLTGHPLNTSLEPSRRDPAADFEAPPSAFKPGHTETLLTALEWRGFQVRWLLSTGKGGLPKNAIYLNVAQHLLEHRRYFAWLRERPDVTSVFFVHDLIPLDYPEYFPAGYRDGLSGAGARSGISLVPSSLPARVFANALTRSSAGAIGPVFLSMSHRCQRRSIGTVSNSMQSCLPFPISSSWALLNLARTICCC